MSETHVTVAVAGEGGSDAEFGLIGPQLSPAGTVSIRLTVPAKPCVAACKVIVEVAEEPMMAGGGEEAEMVKSGGRKVKVAFVEWEIVPFDPVMVTM